MSLSHVTFTFQMKGKEGGKNKKGKKCSFLAKKKKRKSIFSQMRKEAPGSQGEEAQPHVSSNGNQ